MDIKQYSRALKGLTVVYRVYTKHFKFLILIWVYKSETQTLYTLVYLSGGISLNYKVDKMCLKYVFNQLILRRNRKHRAHT